MLQLKYLFVYLFIGLYFPLKAQWNYIEHASNAKHQFSIESFWLGNSSQSSSELPDFGLFPTRYLQYRLAYQYNITPTIGIKTGIGIRHQFSGFYFKERIPQFPIRYIGNSFYYQNTFSAITIPLLVSIQPSKALFGKRVFIHAQAGLEMLFVNSSSSRSGGTSHIGTTVERKYSTATQFYQKNVPSLAGSIGLRYLLKNSNFITLNWYNTYTLKDDFYDIDAIISDNTGSYQSTLNYRKWVHGLGLGYNVSLGKNKEAPYRDYREQQESHRRTTIGVEAGITNDKYRLEESGNGMRMDPLINGMIGINVEHELNKWLSLETAFLRKQYYAGWDFIISPPSGGGYTAYLSWQIPLRAKFTKSFENGRFKIYGLSGIKYNYNQDSDSYSSSSGESRNSRSNIAVQYTAEGQSLSKHFGLVELGGGISFMILGELDLNIFNVHNIGWQDVYQINGTYQVDGSSEESFQLTSKGNFSEWGIQLKYPISRLWN